MKHGFQATPFSTSWYGKDNTGSYSYQLCRLDSPSKLEIIEILAIKGGKWIQISLSIFHLNPELKSLNDLKGKEGTKFSLLPNSLMSMRLKSTEIRGLHNFNYEYIFRNHNLKSFKTEKGFEKRVKQLGDIIESDLRDIDSYIKKWYDIYKEPFETHWDGTFISGTLPEVLKGTSIHKSYYGKGNVPVSNR